MTISSTGLIEWTPSESDQIKTYSNITITITTASGYVFTQTFDLTVNASSATTISTRSYHTCAVLDNGSAKCWGHNQYGRLGIDNDTQMGDGSGEMSQLTGINLGTGRTATSISAGNYHSCALLDNGAVKCWGGNGYGQLGIDNETDMGDGSGEMSQLTGINLGTGRTATAISAGWGHTCALLDNGTVKCWGYNIRGQLGIGNTENMGDNSSEMSQLTGINLGTGRTATAISAGGFHSCAVLDNGAAKCWGLNSLGQLGIGNTENMGDNSSEMSQLTGISLGTGRTATAISAGENHTCAVLDDASVKCWGRNDRGHLGIDNDTQMGDGSGEMAQLTGINLGTGRTAITVSAGVSHSCALLDNGAVKCWGYNGYGQLGIDNDTQMGDGSGEMSQLTGINLGTGRTATAIAAGGNISCAKLDNSSVKCWGSNYLGQLGIDSGDDMGDDPGEMGDNLPSVKL
jgi:alpha-tubulin suppressor-like RCC1 family protein